MDTTQMITRTRLVPMIILYCFTSCFFVDSADHCISGLSSRRYTEVQYVPPNAESNLSQQIIFPGIQFDCTGFITAWSALTVLDIRFIQPNTLMHQIHFQVWRPNAAGTLYRLVGSNHLMFDFSELQSVFQLDNSTHTAFLNFTNKSVGMNEINFQPGDVVGCLIPAHYRSILASLTPAYSLSMNVTDMYIVYASEQLCEISQCDESAHVIQAVAPQISLNYELRERTPTEPLADECRHAIVDACIKVRTTDEKPVNAITQETPCNGNTNCLETGHGVPGALLIILSGVLSIVLFPVLIIAATLLCLLKRFSQKSTSTSTVSREGQVPCTRRRIDIAELKSVMEISRQGQSEDSVYDDQTGLQETAIARQQSFPTHSIGTCSTYV